MKRQLVLTALVLVLAVEILTLVLFAVQTPETEQNTVVVNEIVQAVTKDFDSMENHQNLTVLNYVVIDNDGKVLYRTQTGLAENLNAAIVHRDIILDIEIDKTVVGKVIIENNETQTIQAQKRTTIVILAVATGIQGCICIGYVVYLHLTMIKPFRKLKGFAERVAGGNLDVPLAMDRQNLFGAFTESFDLMRTELKKARNAEAQANASKKELIAKLSHDIKTPVASIKAVAEVGATVTANQKDKANYAQIIGKADQINTLVTNLFTSTLEELQQLTVSPSYLESRQVKTMLENADYLHRAKIPDLPECLVHVDGLRLQQVFDNIFANSYKYANTDIRVTVEKTPQSIAVAIEDFGGGVSAAELPTLKEKFKRGSNATNIEGAGLGLYIADYFMQAMNGELKIQNTERGLKVTVCLALSGKI